MLVRHRHQEENMAIVLMGIVSIFLVCNSFRIFLNFYEAVFEINKFHGTTDGPKTSLKQKQWFNNASIISNLFVTLNACSNLIIYCAMNSQFRNHFFQTIPFCKLHFFRGGIENTPSKIENDTLAITNQPPTNATTETTELNERNENNKMEIDESSILIEASQKTNDMKGKVDFV